MSLLQKLKSGFGVRDHEEHHEAKTERREPAAEEQSRAADQAEHAARHVERRPQAPAESPYAPRQTGGSLDPMGRPAAQQPTPARPLNEDDQLDIPAFLRRQAN